MMALSLSSGRSIAAASPANPVGSLVAWFARAKLARTRRIALAGLLDLDPARLADLGISRDDIGDALVSGNGRTPGMVLHAARARSARL